MKNTLQHKHRAMTFVFGLALLSTLNPQLSTVLAQGTAFTYQGLLNDGAGPANGSYDLTFSVWDASSGPSQTGGTQTNLALLVSNGLFTVNLDFGAGVFTGDPRWLEISVATNGSANVVTLSPRQALLPTPYAMFAANAATVGSGAVVKSLNALTDGVTLAGGSNVTITTSGNTLTIDSVGAGGSGIWNLNGADTYFTAGKVGIGTSTPKHRLGIAGGPSWTANLWKGAIDLENAAAIGWQGVLGGQRFGIGHTTGGLYFFRTTSDPGTTASPANYDMEITDSGNVMIAGGTEQAGIKLQVNGPASFAPGGNGGGFVSFGTPNFETGMTISGNGYSRADLRFDGSTLKLVAGPVGGPPSSANGVAITTGGDVGIGTTGPAAKLDVAANSDAIHGTSTAGIGVFGAGSGSGVYGNGGVTGEGVHGTTSGNGAAVNGTSTGGGTGVYGTSASGYAGYFDGNVNVTGAQYVQSRLFANSGVDASGSGATSAIFAHNTTGLAGNFVGNVFVSGNLSKGGGSFKIDHPLDPANKYLSHSFVESPDMMNIYNGNIGLDGKGEAVVSLPEWFDALNKDFRYQLTAIGAPGPNLYIAEEIAGNQFKIAGGKPGTKVSWQVTGVRQDAFANANRIKVEEEKTGSARGSYLHPELFGQPSEKRLAQGQP
jgi:trimeric autotransporter adhesin